MEWKNINEGGIVIVRDLVCGSVFALFPQLLGLQSGVPNLVSVSKISLKLLLTQRK
jgi:hypothetical protein